jgi:hypothetical protein
MKKTQEESDAFKDDLAALSPAATLAKALSPPC